MFHQYILYQFLLIGCALQCFRVILICPTAVKPYENILVKESDCVRSESHIFGNRKAVHFIAEYLLGGTVWVLKYDWFIYWAVNYFQ